MAKFDTKTLSDLHEAGEVAIPTERHPDSAVVIWGGGSGRRGLRSIVSAAPKGAGTGTSRQVDRPHWRSPAGGWRCRRCRQTTKRQPRGRAASTFASTGPAPMPRRWSSPPSCPPRCGWSRAEQRRSGRATSLHSAGVKHWHGASPLEGRPRNSPRSRAFVFNSREFPDDPQAQVRRVSPLLAQARPEGPASGATSARSSRAQRRRSTSARCSTSSGTDRTWQPPQCCARTHAASLKIAPLGRSSSSMPALSTRAAPLRCESM